MRSRRAAQHHVGDRVSTVTYVLIPGAASSSWHWHLLAERLRAHSQQVVTVDLPVDDDAAGLADYAGAVVDAVDGPLGRLVLVAHSFAGFCAPLVCEQVPVTLLVLLNAMVPSPGETAGQWWDATGHVAAVERAATSTGAAAVDGFFHDLPSELAVQARARVREQSDTPFAEPWPLEAWPDVPTRVLISRGDRVLPVALQRTVAKERLHLVPDEMDGGHFVALSRPGELADRLQAYADGTS